MREDTRLIALVVALLLSQVWLWVQQCNHEGAVVKGEVQAVAPSEPPELAPYMDKLQRMTHKLSLAVAAKNLPLVKFYAYEMGEISDEIKSEVASYRGHAIALHVDRILDPALRKLQSQVDAGKQNTIGAAYSEIIVACNQCHQVTNHGFIKIPERADGAPFLQIFEH